MHHDLEALERAPGRLVLSACDSGLSAVRPGDELMGLAAAMFMLGTRTLAASVSFACFGIWVSAQHQEPRAGRAPGAQSMTQSVTTGAPACSPPR